MADFDWNKLTIPQLKEQLKKRGLDQSGKKADLIGRLVASNQVHHEDAGKGEALDNPTIEHETKDEEQMDTSENPADSNATDHAATEPDFTENITFEELEKTTTTSEGIQQPVKSTEMESDHQEESAAKLTEEAAEASTGGKEEVEGGSAEGEGKTTGEGTEDGKEPVEELPDVSDQFHIDIPRERDCFYLTWNGKKFAVPFRLEVNSDLLPVYKAQSLVVSPVQLSDLDTELFKRLFERATKVSIDFFGRAATEEKSGRVKLLFKAAEEAEQAKEELKSFRETLSIDPMDFEFKEYEDDFVPVNKRTESSENSGSLVHRLLFVGNLPSDVTEAALTELFPDALRVILPHKENEGNAENLEQTRYAYVEFPSEDETSAARDKYKELTLNDEKLFVIRAIPVRKDRFGLLSDTLRQILLDKVRKLQIIIKTPYNKSQQDLDDIQRNVDQIKEKLAADTKHRLGWNMLLGRLDECVLDREEDPQFAERNRGGRGGRGGRGQMRGGNMFYGGQGARRGMSGMGGSPSYGYGGSGMGYGRGGWNSGYGGGGYQSYYGGGGNTYPTQSYGGGYNQFSGKRRASYDNFGGEWKRGRGGGGSYKY